jgi:heme exporter protein A
MLSGAGDGNLRRRMSIRPLLLCMDLPSSAMIATAQLTRSFGRRKAVNGVDLSVREGECLALFGPNGAGKTTCLRLLAGLLKPTSGSVRIGGHDLREHSSARTQIGFISHQHMLYRALTARENLLFTARLYGVSEPEEAAERALLLMSVPEVADRPVRALSRGLQQRVSIARAVVHRPRVVLLDEPYTGLDTIGASALTSMLETLRASGATLVLVTHQVDEGLALASHAGVMLEGRLVQHQSTAGLGARDYAEAYRDLVTSHEADIALARQVG